MPEHPIHTDTGNQMLQKRKFSISPQQVFNFMGAVILLFASISIILSFLRYVLDYNNRLIEILRSLFYLDKEFNFPTYWSTLLLLGAALLLAYIFIQKHLNKDRYRYYWLVLAGVFLLLSMDEFMSIHERMTEPMQGLLKPNDWLYLAWVVPASIAVGIGLIFYLKFLFNLRLVVRKRFIYSALLYVGGAIGLELVGGYIIVAYGMRNFMYATTTNLEETLEMFGIAYFIFTLMDYISKDLQQKTAISFPLQQPVANKTKAPDRRPKPRNYPAEK